MTAKIYFGPYVRGPEESRQAKRESWLERVRGLAMALLGSDRVTTAEGSARRSCWAYRVVRSPDGTVAEHPRRIELQLAANADLRQLALEAVEPPQLAAGDLIVVQAGQAILADGTIVAGAAVVDESAITGHSEPQVCTPEAKSSVLRDSQVLAGEILVRVSPRRGHPLDWIDSSASPKPIAQSNLRRTPVRS